MTPSKKNRKDVDIDALFEDGTLIDHAINTAVKNALERHKKLSQPIVVWRNNKVVVIEPKDIDKELESHDKSQ